MRERVVDQTVARVEQIAPDHRDCDHRGHDRSEQRGAEQALEAGETGVEQQRGCERYRDRSRHADHDEIKRVAKRFPEQRCAQQVEVVAEPDEAQVVQVGERVEIEIGEAQRERREHRQHEECADHDQGRRGKQPCGTALVHRRAPGPANPRAPILRPNGRVPRAGGRPIAQSLLHATAERKCALRRIRLRWPAVIGITLRAAVRASSGACRGSHRPAHRVHAGPGRTIRRRGPRVRRPGASAARCAPIRGPWAPA